MTELDLMYYGGLLFGIPIGIAIGVLMSISILLANKKERID